VALLLIVLLLILILGGVGLAVLKLLFWIALIMFVLWLIGFFVAGSGRSPLVQVVNGGGTVRVPRAHPVRWKV
jgi:hypothetical protein